MSTNYEFKKITDVDVIQKAGDSSYVMVEDAGILKKMAAKNIGAVKTVNGAEPNENGDVQIEIPEAKEITVNGITPDENGNIEVQAGTQPDWNQNDDAAVDFVKHRTHYDVGEDVEIELLPATDIEFVSASLKSTSKIPDIRSFRR